MPYYNASPGLNGAGPEYAIATHRECNELNVKQVSWLRSG